MIPLTPPPAPGLKDLGKSERPAGDGVPLKDRTDAHRAAAAATGRRGRTFRSPSVVSSEFQQNTSQRVDTFIERVTKPDSGLIDSTPFSDQPTETYRNVFLTRRSIYCYLFIGGRRGSRSDEIFVRIVRVRQSSAVNVAVRRPIFATKKGTKDFRRAFWPPSRYKTQRLRPTAGKRWWAAGDRRGGRKGGRGACGSGRERSAWGEGGESAIHSDGRGKGVQVERCGVATVLFDNYMLANCR